MALYDPTNGYYARPNIQVGRQGDFYTSVSVGSLFGKLLARRFLKWWESNEQPSAWRILEIGAHNGFLAEDIASEIKALSPVAWSTLEYAIPEPLPHLRALQIQRLEPVCSRFHSATDFSEFTQNPLPGIAFGNEILDALPFHLVKMCEGKWQELFVTLNDNEDFTWTLRNIESHSLLDEKLTTIGQNFPEGYQTEVRTNVKAFLMKISSCLLNGSIIFADYGFAHPEYYDISRDEGTLRTYERHKASDDPLSAPGEMDITAHVNFTDLAQEASEIGYSPNEYTSQGNYLTHLAKPMIMAGELVDQKSINQFQTLIHPAHLGARFHFIELSKGIEMTPQVAHRLALKSI